MVGGGCAIHADLHPKPGAIGKAPTAWSRARIVAGSARASRFLSRYSVALVSTLASLGDTRKRLCAVPSQVDQHSQNQPHKQAEPFTPRKLAISPTEIPIARIGVRGTRGARKRRGRSGRDTRRAHTRQHIRTRGSDFCHSRNRSPPRINHTIRGSHLPRPRR